MMSCKGPQDHERHLTLIPRATGHNYVCDTSRFAHGVSEYVEVGVLFFFLPSIFFSISSLPKQAPDCLSMILGEPCYLRAVRRYTVTESLACIYKSLST